MSNEWFSTWIGKDADDVLKEFQIENLYEIIEKLPDDMVTSADLRDRARIWYDVKTNKVTDITVG